MLSELFWVSTAHAMRVGGEDLRKLRTRLAVDNKSLVSAGSEVWSFQPFYQSQSLHVVRIM